MSVESRYARPLAAKTFNHWADLVSRGKYGWSPTKNTAFKGILPESGMVDGIATLYSDGHVSTCIGVEVKGFDEGKLDFGIYRENQRVWEELMLLECYIFLMGFPNIKVTDKTDLRKSEYSKERNLVKIWLVPVSVWINSQHIYEEQAGMKTIYWDENVTRIRKSAKESGLFLSTWWINYELSRAANGYWYPNPQHNLRKCVFIR